MCDCPPPSLSVDSWLHCLGFLGPADCLRARLVCRTWGRLVAGHTFCAVLEAENFPDAPRLRPEPRCFPTIADALAHLHGPLTARYAAEAAKAYKGQVHYARGQVCQCLGCPGFRHRFATFRACPRLCVRGHPIPEDMERLTSHVDEDGFCLLQPGPGLYPSYPLSQIVC